MIRNEDAIAAARALIGTPYSELDCINLIKRVIRTAPGGVPWYTTAGTNALWVSANASAKYRDLTWRQEGLQGARAGELARGTTVDVLAEPCDGWLYVRAGGVSGYASAAYLARVTYASAGKSAEDVRPAEMSGANASFGEAEEEPYTTIRREDGATIRLAGRWAVLED